MVKTILYFNVNPLISASENHRRFYIDKDLIFSEEKHRKLPLIILDFLERNNPDEETPKEKPIERLIEYDCNFT